MARPFATIILAGGKGTRMGSSDKHKVCFEVLGVPVIIRALETYNLCGAALNVVVVGMLAETVMATVNRRFPGTAYAFQESPRGTGDAARKGAEILERLGFQGDILVVAGDKVMEPKVLRHLLATHAQAGADVTIATAKRPANSSAGILLKSARGNIVGILEEQDRQRLASLALITATFAQTEKLPRSQIEQLIAGLCAERTSQRLMTELFPTEGPHDLLRTDFEQRFTPNERAGLLQSADEQVRAAEALERFNQMNLSTYLFRAPVLYDCLSRLKPNRASQEEYLTDVFELLARGSKPARVIGSEIVDPLDLMAFNNPQELLAIEQVYRERQARAEGNGPGTAPRLDEVSADERPTVCSISVWQNMLASPSPAAARQFRSWYGDVVPWDKLASALEDCARTFGQNREVAIIRSPGRINLMGRHIDHQGGCVNVMAVDREIILIASPRSDDVVSLANADESKFTSQTFRVSDLIAKLNWDDWQHVVDGPRLHRLLEAARGDWANYVKAAILRLQEQFRDRQLRGLDILVSGNIPMGAGLSSSSALVVAAAEAVRAFNRLPVSARRLVSLCGEGEWFVGTRGGAADHAAIRLSRRGCVTRVGFFPFDVQDSAPFFPDHDLVACNSGIYAGKSSQARNTFNAKVTAYHIGRVWFKMLRPDLAEKIEHLRDIDAETLGLSQADFMDLLSRLPARISRTQVQVAFKQIAEAERNKLERLFSSHDAPSAGYSVRGVVLFGLAEMDRAKRCLDLLKSAHAAELGRLMNISHDGDRVSHQVSEASWRLIRPRESATLPVPGKALAEMAGAYGCSLTELDRIVDIARTLPGVEGAQLAGAGLGGCIMVLVKKAHTPEVLRLLEQQEISAEVFRPIAGASSLVAV